MLASFIIVFREAFEAGLIIGVVLAASQGVPKRGRWVIGGAFGGVLGAIIVATFAGSISAALDGFGQEIFTAAILVVAVMMLGWHNTWMAKHGREIAQDLSAFAKAVKQGDKSLAALAVVVGAALLREGSEVALFLYGVVKSSGESPLQMLLGGVMGLGTAGLLSFLLYRGLVAIPQRYLFAVTNGLIVLIAAGMAGQAAAVLASADILPSLGSHLWNTSFVLSDQSVMGKAMHALVGYSAQPSGVQVLSYLVTLGILIALSRWSGASQPARKVSPATTGQ